MRSKHTRSLLALAAAVALALGLATLGDVSAATLAARLTVGASGTYSSAVDLATADQALKYAKNIDLTNGVGLNQADKLFTDTRTVAASTTEDLDVAAGALTDAFGTAFTLAKMKALIVCAASGNTNNVVLGGDINSVPFLSTAATTVSIKPGGCFQLVDPSLAAIAVTGGTGDIIQVANGGAGTSVTYDIVIVGTSS